MDSALARLSLRFLFSVMICGAIDLRFYGAKAFNIGYRRVVYWQKSIIYFLHRLLPPSLLRQQSPHEEFLHEPALAKGRPGP